MRKYAKGVGRKHSLLIWGYNCPYGQLLPQGLKGSAFTIRKGHCPLTLNLAHNIYYFAVFDLCGEIACLEKPFAFLA